MSPLPRLFAAPAALLIGLLTLAAAPAPSPAIDRAGMDAAVAPGDDFFAYANGSWVKTTEIPADRARWGVGAIMADLTDRRTADLIRETAASRPPAASQARKIADYYDAYMDEGAIEAAGGAPLAPALARIAGIADKTALAAALGGELRADVDILNATNLHTDRLLGLWVAQDLDDPSRYAPFLVQGGLGMPDRDYYLDPSSRMQVIRTSYQAHIAKVLTLAGVPDAPARAAAIFDLERRIAATHVSRADTEDVRKGDNHWAAADFPVRAPGLDWKAYFAAAGLGKQNRFVVWQPSAVTGIAALVGQAPLSTWRDYMIFHAIDRAAPVLPKAFVDENFDFYARVLSGTPALSPRWRRAVDATNAALGEAVGRLYVERYFPPAAKAKIEDLATNLIAAFGRRIDALTWMAPETKVQAKAKLAALKVGVGYPDKWRDYSGLDVIRYDALGNLERAGLFEYHRNLAKLGAPVDRSEWVMTPQTVNAVNLPAMNALNFPAAILQSPDFDPAAPAAMNYGAIGATIGHEISHSFDDQGALFDATGRLRDWWTAADFAHFQASAAQLAREFDAYRPFLDLSVNGRQTLSENIADVAGLAVAYDAYVHSLSGQPAPVADGFTGDQQFFLAFAQSWRSKSREAALRRQVLTDGHAPAQYRADTARNIDTWYAAFGVKPGQTLFLAPDDRVRMW
ncbi:MAG: M13 family metallopeptidase [Pseudomonadota bacterium]|nr:M13 family metallopeptidase [Pseudomonadota bacterium]